MPSKKSSKSKPMKAGARAAVLLDLARTPELEPTPALGATPPLGPTPALTAAPVAAFSGASGDDVLAIARRHLGEPYILGARAPLGNANWRGPWDCAEFVSWCVFQASRIIYGAEPRHDPMLADAFTGFWARHAEAGRHTVSVDEAAAIPGAAVLRKPVQGQIGHIVFSDGRGGSVEAHSTKRGVIESTLSGRRWDYGVLVSGIRNLRAEVLPALNPPQRVIRLTQPLTRGDTVRDVQRRLLELGFAPGSADGIYGPQTAFAVRHFRANEGLVADGEVGAATLAAPGLG